MRSNTATNGLTTTEPGVDTCVQALRELQQMFPGMWCYVEQTLNSSVSPAGNFSIDTLTEIQIDKSNGEVLYNEAAPTLSECMPQVREWKQEHDAKHQTD